MNHVITFAPSSVRPSDRLLYLPHPFCFCDIFFTFHDYYHSFVFLNIYCNRTLLIQPGTPTQTSFLEHFNVKYFPVSLSLFPLDVSYTLSSITQTLPRSLFLLPDGNADSLSQILKLSKDTILCTHHTGYIRVSNRE